MKFILLLLFCDRFIIVIRCLFHNRNMILIFVRIEIYIFRKIFITRSMISLSLFEIYFIIIILYSTYCRYLTFILISLFDFNFYENRKLMIFVNIFIMRLIILLLLFDDYFIYLIFDLLLLFDVRRLKKLKN